jgi:hypothetical protein
LRAYASVVLQLLSRKEFFVEAELSQVVDAHRIEDAVQMINLVLDHTCVKAAHPTFDRLSVQVNAFVV